MTGADPFRSSGSRWPRVFDADESYEQGEKVLVPTRGGAYLAATVIVDRPRRVQIGFDGVEEGQTGFIVHRQWPTLAEGAEAFRAVLA